MSGSGLPEERPDPPFADLRPSVAEPEPPVADPEPPVADPRPSVAEPVEASSAGESTLRQAQGPGGDADPNSPVADSEPPVGDPRPSVAEPRPSVAEPVEASPGAPRIEPPTADVEAAASTSALPGEHRGGFARLPTAPVGIAEELAALPSPAVGWLIPEPARPYRGIAGWALAFSVIGLAASFFVGWGFPLGLVGVVSAIIALLRPWESRPLAVWALVMGSVSLLFSVGWLLWAADRLELFG